jgi:folate-binding Fe-S cluster repair protein YgfZ
MPAKVRNPYFMLTDGQISYAVLEDRGVVSIKGADARAFLQGLITNNVNRASVDQAIWAAFLTPQGKYLFDFFMIEVAGALLLDCEAARIDNLIARLTNYKLRSQVEIADVSDDWAVAALIGGGTDTSALVGFEGRGGPFAGGVCYVDPRYGGGGSRAILPKAALFHPRHGRRI